MSKFMLGYARSLFRDQHVSCDYVTCHTTGLFCGRCPTFHQSEPSLQSKLGAHVTVSGNSAITSPLLTSRSFCYNTP